MFEDKKVLLVVFNDAVEGILLEITTIIDLIQGNGGIPVHKTSPAEMPFLDIHRSDLLVFWISDLDEESEFILRKWTRCNPCLVIYDGDASIDIKKIIHTDVNGVVSSNSLSELPDALNELSNDGNFACQESIRNVLGKVLKRRVDRILSMRECEVLNLLSLGLTYQEVSTRLHISYDTIKTHTSNIYRKLGARNKTEAVHKARMWMILS